MIQFWLLGANTNSPEWFPYISFNPNFKNLFINTDSNFTFHDLHVYFDYALVIVI